MLRYRFSALLLVGLLLLLTPTDAEKDVDVDSPNECLELKGKDYDQCVEEWLAAHPSPTPASVVLSVGSLPTEIADTMVVTSPPQATFSYSESSPSNNIDDGSTSDFGTANEANYDAAENDASINDPGVEDNSEITGHTVSESDTGDATINNVNDNVTYQDSVLVDDIVYVNIGKYDMSLTIYSSPDMLNDFETNEEYSLFARQYELAATTDHLRKVYQKQYNKKVIALKINLSSDGETKMSQSIVLHSTFDGTVAFDDNSEPELESETLFAFQGDQKQKFLEMFYSFYTEDFAQNKESDDIRTLYDVSVRESSNDDGIVGGTHEASSSHSSAGSDITKLIVLTVTSVIVTVITLICIAVFIRRSAGRQAESKSSPQNAVVDDGKVEKLDVDEEGQVQQEMEALSNLDASSTDIEEKSFDEFSMESSISSGEGKNINPPLPVEISSSSLNSVEAQFMRLKLEVSRALNDNASTWSFNDVGEDNISNSSPGGGSSMANESYGTSLGGASDLFRNVMKYDETVMPKESKLDKPEEEKGIHRFDDDGSYSFQGGSVSGLEDEKYGGSFNGDINDESSSFLGDIHGLEYEK